MLGPLILQVEEIIQESSDFNVDRLKRLLIMTYSDEKELPQELKSKKNLSDVFGVVRKHCSTYNIDLLLLIVDHCKLPYCAQNQILKLIHQFEEPYYRKKMTSDIESMGVDPSQHCSITLKLKAFYCITVKQFSRIIKNLFANHFPYIHVCIVGVASFNFYTISVIIRAPKSLTKDLQIVVKNNSRLKYFDKTTIAFLKIENEIILDIPGVGIK